MPVSLSINGTVVDTQTLVGPTAGSVVTFDTTVLNQNEETVLVYRDKLAIKKRP